MAGPGETTRDARELLASLVGQPLSTISGAPNEILALRDRDVIVATGRSPTGKPVSIALVQDALDRLMASGELQIDVPTLGHRRSAFVGAVLQTLPGARVERNPQRVLLDSSSTDPRMIELARREQMWTALSSAGPVVSASPQELRDLGIYGGAGGVWVDKATTRPASPDGNGIAVAVLHTGRHYADDLTEVGVAYHYPRTARPPGRDLAEIEALKNAHRLRLALFVITEADRGRTRLVRRGWVENSDDEAGEAFISFEPSDPTPLPDDDAPFDLTTHRDGKRTTAIARPNQPRFKLQVLQRYGSRCAMCSVSVSELIKAAHLVPFSKGGTDDPRNGLPLCGNHHDALDRSLVKIDPDSLALVTQKRYSAEELGITEQSVSHLRAKPHRDALQVLWERETLE